MPRSASAAVALVAAAVTTLAGPAALTPVTHASAAGPSDPSAGFTMVHANIKSALSSARFQADVRTVLQDAPDIVTYNEVPTRSDDVMAPEGYDVFRVSRNRYTRANAVAWRSDRWVAVDSGVTRVSNYRKVPRGRKVMLGLRFATWVTLQSFDGRQMSVVSTHVPPLDRNMPDLLRPTVKQIGALVETLAPSGPVLVGGDFNVHYKSGRYPRDLLTPPGMVPTYDTLGTFFPTGDHKGATIDYVFNRGADQLEAQAHRKKELHSDHDAVVADLGWTTDAPVTTEHFVSDPASPELRGLALGQVLQAIRSLAPGDRVNLVSAGISLRSVRRQLVRAGRRGVEVSVRSRSRNPGRSERRLNRQLQRTGAGRVVPCRDACLQRWRDVDMAPTFLLVRGASGPTLRIDASRTLGAAMLQRRTHLYRHTGSVSLEQGEEMLAALR